MTKFILTKFDFQGVIIVALNHATLAINNSSIRGTGGTK